MNQQRQPNSTNIENGVSVEDEKIPSPRQNTPSPQKCIESPERSKQGVSGAAASNELTSWDQSPTATTTLNQRAVKTSRTFRPSDRLLRMSRVASQQQTPETERREKHPQHIRMGSNPELILNKPQTLNGQAAACEDDTAHEIGANREGVIKTQRDYKRKPKIVHQSQQSAKNAPNSEKDENKSAINKKQPYQQQNEQNKRQNQQIDENQHDDFDGGSEEPRELLSSEIDVVSSNVEQMRSSTTSLQEFATPHNNHTTNNFGQTNPQKALEIVKYKYPETAIPLVTVNGEEKFEINKQAIEMLSHIKGPIGVISVAGMYRTGKSYLLNRVLLNRQKGFGVGPSINPCTKGIWIWGAPLAGFSDSGEPLNVLVVDSEGLGGIDEDNNHDMRIFSLALLISSYFVYNSMGAIDESAIQSLSLVVNLTKHIRTSVAKGQATSPCDQKDLNNSETNSNNLEGQDMTSFAELESVMPHFMWVVRDFSLQLADPEGNEITPSEYLEIALNQQNRSDVNNPMNAIKKAIQGCFRQRDCCTMVRPHLNEEVLQTLETLEIEQLRPEFIEQVMNLRMKVLNRLPIKRVKGHALNGKTWAHMLQMYVLAMNSGSVPNVESSWKYICQGRAKENLQAAIEHFQKETEAASLPVSSPDLQTILAHASTSATKILTKDLIGDDEFSAEVVREFEIFKDQRLAEIKEQNENAQQEYAQQILVQLFSELQQVKTTIQTEMNGAQDAFTQVDFALREVSAFYESNTFEFADKRLFLAESKTQFVAEILALLSQKATNSQKESDQIQSLLRDRYEVQLRDAKEEFRGEQTRLETLQKEALIAKSESEAQNQILSEQLLSLKTSKEKDDEDTAQLIRKLRSDLSKSQEDQQVGKESYEDQLKDAQRQTKQMQSEFDKERALLEQQVKYLEEALNEKSARERDSTSELRSQKDQIAHELKALSQKHDNDLQILVQQLEDEKEKVNDLESQVLQKTEMLQNGEKKFQEIEQALRKQIEGAKSQLKDLQSSQSQQKLEKESQLGLKVKKQESEVKRMKDLIDDLEKKVKESQESLQKVSHEGKKDLAMRDQKIEFLEMQLKESKEQMQESHRQHESMMDALNRHGGGLGSDSEEENQATARLELLQEEFESTRQAHTAKIAELTNSNEELVAKCSNLTHQNQLATDELHRKLSEALSNIDHGEVARKNLLEKIKILENSRVKAEEESVSAISKAKQQFELDLSEKEEAFKHEMSEIKQSCEDQITQMKVFFEQEKSKLETRLNEERDRASRRVTSLQDEMEASLREETRDKELEIEVLQAQLNEMEQTQQSLAEQFERELNLKVERIDSLERQISEDKQRLDSYEQTKALSFEKQIEQFEGQRVELTAKIDRLMSESLEKDKTIASMTHKVERASETLSRRTEEEKQAREQSEREKVQIGEKLDATRNKLTAVQDEAMQLKLESGREQALLNQQVEFLNRKIEEQQKVGEDSQRLFEEKLKNCRQEIIEDTTQQVERVTSEKELWETKYEQKRKALKELENSLGTKNGDLEKQNSLLRQQLANLESESADQIDKATEEISYLQTQLANMDTSADQAFTFGSAQAEDLMKVKSTLQESERELQDLQSNYERDKALWEGKVMFLETQKDNYKRDLLESQRKFELTIEQLQKRGNHNKEKSESTQQAFVKAMENKYKSQIKELMETHQALNGDSKGKIKRLEAENQALTAKVSQATASRHEDLGALEKQYVEIQASAERLTMELEEVKSERNRRVSEFQSQIDKERDTFKQKLLDSEKRAKDAESKRAQLLFSIEKDKANWVMEDDQLRRRNSELEEHITSLEQVRDQLKRENEKLRVDMRMASGNRGANGVTKKQFMLGKAGGVGSASNLSTSANNNANVSSAISLSSQSVFNSNVSQHSGGNSAQGASKYLIQKGGLQLQQSGISGGQGGVASLKPSGSQSSLTGGASQQLNSGSISQLQQANQQNTPTANSIINEALSRIQESKLQRQQQQNNVNVGVSASGNGSNGASQQTTTNSLNLKPSKSSSSLNNFNGTAGNTTTNQIGAGGAMDQSPRTQYSKQSAFTNARNSSSNNTMRQPFTPSTNQMVNETRIPSISRPVTNQKSPSPNPSPSPSHQFTGQAKNGLKNVGQTGNSSAKSSHVSQQVQAASANYASARQLIFGNEKTTSTGQRNANLQQVGNNSSKNASINLQQQTSKVALSQSGQHGKQNGRYGATDSSSNAENRYDDQQSLDEEE